MAAHYDLRRVMRHGNPPLVVIRRELDLGNVVLKPGDPYPIDWSDKRQVMRARQYDDQHRIVADPKFIAEHIPGAAKALGLEPKEPKKEKKNGVRKA